MLKELRQWFFVLILAVIMVFIIRNFVFRMIRVDGRSMEPTFQNEDLLMESPIPYFFRDPHYGDVIVFHNPQTPEEVLIKRVIAVGGDEIEIDGGYVILNGITLQEDFLDEETWQKGEQNYPLSVPEGYYFVMGDNRNYSTDSRYYSVGLIQKQDILGKIFFRVKPFSQFGFIGQEV